MKKEVTKNEKAITLIALVVTIVVLLILAGISISMLGGENGIIKQAQDTKVKQSYAEVKEGIQLAYSEYLAENKILETTTFITDLQEKEIINTEGIVNTKNLLGSKSFLGNGTGTTDVYKIEEENNTNYLKF